ncbi:MAG: M1 family metallopeptidase [Sphingomonas bacterium]|nr:M1 family metallopeptidase [Sphingomonas bacterium]
MIVAASALLLAGCQAATAPAPKTDSAAAPAIAPILDTPDAVDVHSYAKPLEARVTHLALDLGVDFTAKRIGGTATLDIAAKPGATSIILDDKGLEIEKIATAEGAPLTYKVGAIDENLGAPLEIAIGTARKIVITYKSAADAGALQWLSPAQTAGKKQPYLFSQGQAIENRTWIPTQDSPGIRQTWEAKIRVAQPLTAVMSAPKVGDPVTEGDARTFSFKMDRPVAPYLIAIGVGDLAFKSLGPRTGVWTEPSMLDKAAAELADTEKMVAAAEALYGPYQWGRYDLLVLPPSFPFGGMENPTLTFLTPTFIAGDKSNNSLIAHELAHSWSGNLATNATWSDFWLNEGMTTYATTRIVEAVYGPKVAAQQISLGHDAMRKAVEENGGVAGADTRLRIDLKGRNPDEGLTDIAYEKGAAFLRTIEIAVGRERFDAWLKGWFARHMFQPVTTSLFLADIRQHLVKGDAALESRLMLDAWVDQPGIPTSLAPADPTIFAEVDSAVTTFAAGTMPDTAMWGRWTTDERLRFLTRIDRKQPLDRLEALGRQFGLARAGNNELRFAFLDLAVANRLDPAVPALEDFLMTQGRRKYVRPLLTALAEDPSWGRPIALRIYPRARPLYHPVTTRDIDKLLGWAGAEIDLKRA